jgi:hypothetical protein
MPGSRELKNEMRGDTDDANEMGYSDICMNKPIKEMDMMKINDIDGELGFLNNKDHAKNRK